MAVQTLPASCKPNKGDTDPRGRLSKGIPRMAKRRAAPTASDDKVRALLDRYQCPVPFHAVRTRFLGNIASPDM